MEYRKIIDIEFREFNREVLEKTWEWLNDPVMRELTVAANFDKEAQEKWFQSIQGRDDYYIRSVWRDNEPIAVFGIKHITGVDGEIWGYIGEKRYWGKAVGVNMLCYLLEQAKSMGLQSVYAKLLKKNLNSFKLLKRFGSEIEEELDDDMIKMRLKL